MIRRDWKYVYWPEFDYEQLFNLKEDAQEIRNLADDPAHAGQRATMRQKLDEWREAGAVKAACDLTSSDPLPRPFLTDPSS